MTNKRIGTKNRIFTKNENLHQKQDSLTKYEVLSTGFILLLVQILVFGEKKQKFPAIKKKQKFPAIFISRSYNSIVTLFNWHYYINIQKCLTFLLLEE